MSPIQEGEGKCKCSPFDNVDAIIHKRDTIKTTPDASIVKVLPKEWKGYMYTTFGVNGVDEKRTAGALR